MLHIGFMQVLILQSLKPQYYKNLYNIKIVLFTIKWAKTFRCYNSHKVSLCDDCIYSYNLYVDATVLLARYVLSKCYFNLS